MYVLFISKFIYLTEHYSAVNITKDGYLVKVDVCNSIYMITTSLRKQRQRNINQMLMALFHIDQLIICRVVKRLADTWMITEFMQYGISLFYQCNMFIWIL